MLDEWCAASSLSRLLKEIHKRFACTLPECTKKCTWSHRCPARFDATRWLGCETVADECSILIDCPSSPRYSEGCRNMSLSWRSLELVRKLAELDRGECHERSCDSGD